MVIESNSILGLVGLHFDSSQEPSCLCSGLLFLNPYINLLVSTTQYATLSLSFPSLMCFSLSLSPSLALSLSSLYIYIYVDTYIHTKTHVHNITYVGPTLQQPCGPTPVETKPYRHQLHENPRLSQTPAGTGLVVFCKTLVFYKALQS